MNHELATDEDYQVPLTNKFPIITKSSRIQQKLNLQTSLKPPTP